MKILVHADNGKPRGELRVPLDMSKMYSAVSIDRRVANTLLREEPEDDEEDEDEQEDHEEQEEEEEEGYPE
jgi:hypothetical protein